jgi:hypothetical protein
MDAAQRWRTKPPVDPFTAWTYFASEAWWTYLTAPFLFTYPGFHTTEVEPFREDGQSYRTPVIESIPGEHATDPYPGGRSAGPTVINDG